MNARLSHVQLYCVTSDLLAVVSMRAQVCIGADERVNRDEMKKEMSSVTAE